MGLVVEMERKKRREGRRLPIVDPLDAPSDTTPWDGRRAYSLCQAYMDTVIKDGASHTVTGDTLRGRERNLNRRPDVRDSNSSV